MIIILLQNSTDKSCFLLTTEKLVTSAFILFQFSILIILKLIFWELHLFVHLVDI